MPSLSGGPLEMSLGSWVQLRLWSSTSTEPETEEISMSQETFTFLSFEGITPLTAALQVVSKCGSLWSGKITYAIYKWPGTSAF